MNRIKTDQRIFQVFTFDYDGPILCNIDRLSFNKEILLDGKNPIKSIKHYWNYKFQTIGKIDVKEMIINNNLK